MKYGKILFFNFSQIDSFDFSMYNLNYNKDIYKKMGGEKQ